MEFIVANDNGNSEHKISVDGVLHRQPSVYTMYNIKPVEVRPLNDVVNNLLENIIVTIDSKTVAPIPTTYAVGHKAMETFEQERNNDIDRAKKHLDNTPLINTLGILSALAVKKQYEKNGTLDTGETIDLEINMTTALPASIHDEETIKEFSERFKDYYHEVKVHFNNTHATVKVKFKDVKVVAEGVPALFTIIEDGNDSYRDDDMFDEFKELYGRDVDGEYFSDKRLLHVDIGEGTTELTFTKGYEQDYDKSDGKPMGLGSSLETAITQFENEMSQYNLKVSRQQMSSYLKDKDHNFHELAKKCVEPSLIHLGIDLLEEIKKHASKLKLEFDVIVVYGGASILLKEALYSNLVDEYKLVNKEVLWIPEKYAVEMNVNGMEILNKLTYAAKEN